MLADFDVCRCHFDIRIAISHNESERMDFD